MLSIANLEVHVAHGCNLACESCSHYSNQGHKGLLGLDEARAWIQPWADRLAPAKFSLLGGEPALHPRFAEFVPLARSFWPRAHLRLVSNGFLLARHPELPRRLAEAGNARLEVSIHHNSAEYRRRFAPVAALLARWVAEHGIDVRLVDSHAHWTRRYNGVGAAMEPFEDGRPGRSWRNCPARCPQLLEGAIWKCPPLAYLPMQNRKYGLSEKWRPYLQYRPLTPDCDDRSLRAFFARKAESHCAMCAAKPPRFSPPLPFPTRVA
ncbi:radical SAM protein [Sphingosinicella sp.]|uniref:radical SAM protein n=1 Tax=Sphingosinicella sp. TaxID=1917971 RepID=UPI004037B583